MVVSKTRKKSSKKGMGIMGFLDMDFGAKWAHS